MTQNVLMYATLAILFNLYNSVQTITQIDYLMKNEDFVVYWNVPTFQCKSHKVFFDELISKYHIVQNKEDMFKGEQMTILYDPGNFPAILDRSDSSKVLIRNGGVPQNGNMSEHLMEFEQRVNKDIPDENYNGMAVIDFESWRPIFRQNWGSLKTYKDYSIKQEKLKHPYWNDTKILKEATKRFEQAGKSFMEETLLFAKHIRPNGTWGYYAYPYCFNMQMSNNVQDCADEVREENDRINWAFRRSDGLFPSLYIPQYKLSKWQKIKLYKGRITESHRINKKFDYSKKIFPYVGIIYQDTKELLSKDDFLDAMMVMKTSNVNGIILWSSSNSVNNKNKCQKLYNYVEKVLGPILLST